MMVTAYIALGANLGKRQTMLRAAIGRIGALRKTRVTAVATFRFTAPVGGPAGQPDYLNGAVTVETELEAEELLRELLDIEKQFGRDRAHEVRHGPRVLDLDLLMYGDTVMERPGLTLPHPRMHDRRFVLEPLAEIAPQAVHPVLGVTIEELLRRLPKGKETPAD